MCGGPIQMVLKVPKKHEMRKANPVVGEDVKEESILETKGKKSA